ncbi:DUF6011 domain-containing protein [Mycobacterium sp. 852002-51163_SCH5372311]|uniref:DUF6011 domain-containing protein n=1 Tax=Mycobacterium sp. 852002-51163_SCH5372311 TaxID=1834097 RepID=UPI00351453E8
MAALGRRSVVSRAREVKFRCRMTTHEKSRPAANGAATSTAKGSDDFTAPWRHDLHEPLTAEDRADLNVLIAAAERGFRLATRCCRCNQWIVAPSSVRAHMGPVCRAKAGAA